MFIWARARVRVYEDVRERQNELVCVFVWLLDTGKTNKCMFYIWII